MSTLATTLEKFFHTTACPSELPDEIKQSQEHALHAADVLGQAAYPPSGCSSHATLLKEGRANLDSNREPDSDSDPLTVLDKLDSQSWAGDRAGQETDAAVSARSLHELAASARKKLHDAKQAIRYRILVAKLKYDECSTPPYYPYYPHALRVENEKPYSKPNPSLSSNAADLRVPSLLIV
ncbi:hypothetical protein BDZ45DRAFT_743241 [Acephala macrosclerotiorum]|nr:hypothetical protein BDZ45DRAFT_743241 [Acephala macrosclerotiorum]